MIYYSRHKLFLNQTSVVNEIECTQMWGKIIGSESRVTTTRIAESSFMVMTQNKYFSIQFNLDAIPYQNCHKFCVTL